MAISDPGQDKASQTPSEFRPQVGAASPPPKRGWIWFLVIVVLAGGGIITTDRALWPKARQHRPLVAAGELGPDPCP